MKSLYLILLLLPQLLFAQELPKPDYPQNYFASPIHIPILLAGNYGELRPGHFHEGIDIKTRGIIGYRVYASADGYISRVAVSSTGFGNVIYIAHPNGYSTVYGHLHQFNPQLAAYVKRQQYLQESWKIDLSLAPDMFPVKKGEYIALSGATGNVAGPHVHFEIRETKTTHPLNGQLFGLDIKDNISPAVYRIALYDRNKSIYEQTPEILTLHATNGYHTTPSYTVTVNTDKVGFGIQTLDHQNNTHNSFGIYEGILYADGKPESGFQLDNIGYDETRYVDAHYDYKTYIDSRRHFQLLFDLPGNKLPIYHDLSGTNGTVDLSDGKSHPIKIVIKDAAGNASVIKLAVQKSTQASIEKQEACEQLMTPDVRNIFENENVQFYLEPGTLYDNICFRYKQIPATQNGYYSDIYRIHDNEVPLYHFFKLRIKPNKSIPAEVSDKLVFVCKDAHGKRLSVTPAHLTEGWAESTVRSFGDYSVQADMIPPIITPVNIREGENLASAKIINLTIDDKESGVESYRAELDGKWLMFARKKNTIFYTFDEHCPPGNHTLKLTVTDAVGNKTVKTYHFKR